FRAGTRAKLAESGDRTVQLLGGYVRGTAAIAAIDALFIGVPLAILGVPLAVPLAVIVFVGAFVPIVGATVAGAIAALVALVTSGPRSEERRVGKECPPAWPRRNHRKSDF